MIDHTKFNCPWCGAPGQVNYGRAEYTCECRFGKQLQQAPTIVVCSVCGQPWTSNHHRCVSVGSRTEAPK